VIIRTFSKNQLVQFYSNNATNIYHLTSHGIRRVVPQHRDRIVTTDYCDVTSSYVYQDFPNGPAKGTRGMGVVGEWTAWGWRAHPLLSMVFLRVTQIRHVYKGTKGDRSGVKCAASLYANSKWQSVDLLELPTIFPSQYWAGQGRSLSHHRPTQLRLLASQSTPVNGTVNSTPRGWRHMAWFQSLCLWLPCSWSCHIFLLFQLTTLTIHNSLSLSLPAQDLPFSQIFPTIDSLAASGLTPRLYEWSVSSEHLGFFIFSFLH